MRRLIYTAILLLGAFYLTSSCQSDDLLPTHGSKPDKLTARKNPLVSRSVSQNGSFAVNTRYRLWAYNPGDIFGTSVSGILGRESESGYVEMPTDYAKKLYDKFDIYGFTDAVAYNQAADDFLRPDAANGAQPAYAITYNPALKEGFNDYMRAHLSYDAGTGKTSSVMEFKHVLSRIRVQVIQQGKVDGGAESQGLFDLFLHSAEIDGVYDKLVYNVVENKFSQPDEGVVQTSRMLNEVVGQGEPIIPAEAITAPFSESYILPTSDVKSAEPLKLRLIVSGKDASRFSSVKAPSGSERYVVEVPLTDRMNKGEDGKFSLPLVFKPNSSYMLRVVFAEDGVIIFTPTVYPWFEGETDSSENGDWFEDRPLGNTSLFDNLIWSDRNLGAEDFYPQGKERFQKCTGFFYEFGRNIPYFPMRNVGGKLEDCLDPWTNVYPVVSNPEGRFHTPSNAGLNYIARLEDAASATNWYYGYKTDGFYNSSLWNDISGQPVPPGWRLPTQKEFFGIMPTTPHSGNITFLKNLKYNHAGNVGNENSGDFYDDDDVKFIYIHVPNDEAHPNYPDDSKYEANSGPTYGSSIIKQTGDPYGNYKSEYIISRKYDDEIGTPEKPETKRAVWGTIYGIKKVGTSEAYRMRWHVENAVKGENYYYLVIERFTASATDRLSYNENDINYYRNYDWTRPVARLYLPISGLIGDASWHGGQLGCFGTEVIFATSESQTGSSYKTFRIKILGPERTNQFISPTEDRNGTGSQIRLVRESTYQPNKQ